MEELTDLQIAVKAAFKNLVTACNGPTSAAKLCDAQASHISEASSPHWPRMPRADHIRTLECHLGKPLYTREMARSLGFDLVALDDARSPETAVQAALDLVKQIAAFQVLSAQVDADGKKDAHERKLLIQALQKLVSEAHDLITAHSVGA